MTDKRKICVITGTRAEYGLLRHLMHAINQEYFETYRLDTTMYLIKKSKIEIIRLCPLTFITVIERVVRQNILPLFPIIVYGL